MNSLAARANWLAKLKCRTSSYNIIRFEQEQEPEYALAHVRLKQIADRNTNQSADRFAESVDQNADRFAESAQLAERFHILPIAL